MAIQLPKYQRQVGASGPSPVQIQGQTDIGAEIMGTAVSFAGKALDEYSQRVQQHKDEGDIAGYKNDKKIWDEQLKLRKQQARAQGITDEQMMEKVIVPAMDEFTARQAEKGYSKRVQGIVDADWGNHVAITDAREQGEILENAIIKSNIQKSELAKSLEAEGDFDGANEIWDQLRATSKPGQVDEWRSQSRVGREIVGIRQAELDYTNGIIDEQEYEKILKESNDRIQSDDTVMESDKHRHNVETIGKLTNVSRKIAIERSKSISEFKSLDRKGELGGAQLEQLERVMGPEYTETLVNLNYQSMKRGAVDDEDMRKALALVNEYSNSDMDFYKAIKQTEKIGGKAGQRAFWQISEMYKERIDKNVEVNTPLQSYRTDFFEQVTRFVATGDRTGDWYDDRMLRFDKWVGKNPDASIDDYYDFRYKELKTDVAEFVGKFNAPQSITQPTGEPDFDNMTDEELEAYINE
jgi:hypothetical protein